MSHEAAGTGLGPTVLSAIEQQFPAQQRVLHDDLAYRLLPRNMKLLVWALRLPFLRRLFIRATEQRAPGVLGGVLCRKRYIDEKLLDALEDMDLVINLGTGFDTRVYRLPGLAQIPAWEIDQFDNIRAKEALLKKALGRVPPHVTLVAIDFDRQDIGGVLHWQGCPTDCHTFYIMEAVTQYLTKEGIGHTFDFLSQATPGSRLAFTYVIQDFLEGRAMDGSEAVYDVYVEGGIWKWGIDPAALPDFLAQYGWELLEDVSYGELAERYVRPTGRDLLVTSMERVAYARKT